MRTIDSFLGLWQTFVEKQKHCNRLLNEISAFHGFDKYLGP